MAVHPSRPKPEPVTQPSPEILSLSREQLNELGAILKANLTTFKDLERAVSRLTTCSVDGVEITLEYGLVTRLKSRCIRRAFPEYLKETVLRLLHGEACY